MSDMEQRINNLYGSPDTPREKSSEQSTNEAVQRQEKQQDRIDSLYPEKASKAAVDQSPNGQQAQGNPYAILSDDQDRRNDQAYGASSKVDLGSVDLSVIAESFPDEPNAVENLKNNLGFICSETGIEQADIKGIIETVNSSLITGEMFDSGETMKGLYAEHGAALQSKLDAARALVASVPEIQAYLDSTGLGNHPKIIRQTIKAAESPRGTARIQKLMKLHRGK